ncbi:MAG TPA: nicotinate phosphoribosyltransferase [Steroidobacteraceae bacterium]|nr:nicotinate phosphoribosyltransferase [Steroidobacteraceae bacterium]
MSLARPLLLDLYQLTMAQAYFELGMDDLASFELFVRSLPRVRNFLVAAGLAQALEYLEGLRFGPEEIDYLASLGKFSSAFLEHLRGFRFSGSVHAMPEGTPFFAQEPILRVTAPILEAQLAESRILNIVHFQTVIATKAARCALAAGDRQLVDFGLRRAHEADAGLYAARAAFIGGFHGTATVEAGRRFGIALSGTMAHSFIEAHQSEEGAFRDFAASYPSGATLLIDTYDTERAARRAAALAHELRKRRGSHQIRAVRIDSGDLAKACRAVRGILDALNCRDIEIVVSGGLDEHSIEALVSGAVPVDAFGIGTALDVSADAPALDMAYKLEEYAGKARRKRSPGKATWPGVKQVFRERGPEREIVRDRVALATEVCPGEALLAEVMLEGRRLAPPLPLEQIRAYCLREVCALPRELKKLEQASGAEPVQISAALQALAARLDAETN